MPTGVERKVRDDFGKLSRLYTVVQRQCEMNRHLVRLNASDDRSNGDNASITRRKLRTLPKTSEHRFLGVVFKRW